MKYFRDRKRKAILRGCLAEALEERTLFSFGLTTTSSSYTVDTGAQLVFSISRTAGSGSVGDLTSMLYNGTQLEAPFSDTDRYSHYESGLSGGAVVTATVDPNDQWILIACNDTGTNGVGVIQYYLARNGYNNIYMATYSAGPDAPSPGEMRFITYTNHSVLVNAPAPSNNTGDTGAIESDDVFGHADGTTTSKYYGEYRAIDTQTYGLTGGGFGVFMNIGNRETSSGGPFFKDIDYQTTDADSTELYNYTFSGHSQTENFRPGLKGFYALEFTTGATPAAPDYSFIDTLGIGSDITGYVGSSGRGTLAGTASGVPGTLQETVGLSNAADQYWGTPNATTGAYTITGILPGTYTETIYQGELAVGTQTVTIAAGQTTAANITDTLYTPSAANTVFRIGTWDGTPLGFLNSNLITDMHPTDVRMSPWAADSTGVTNFIVGTDPDSDWPMAEWHTETTAAPYLDTTNQITFTLTAAQAATAQTLRIGLTRLDYGRPTINVNNGAYDSPAPALTTQPDSRGLTTGNWRGNNCTYAFNIPTSALVAGTNTIDIYCTSGSTGTIYSGYQIYDAIDLVNTSSLTNAPVLNSITVSPASTTLPLDGTQTFTAAAFDQFDDSMPANITWSTSSGTINGVGQFTAGDAPGTATITATSGSVSGNASVTVATGSKTALTSSAAAGATFGQSVTFTAATAPVSPSIGTPTGTVTFMDGATALGTGTLSDGITTFVTGSLSVGSHSITAVYGGDANFITSTSSPLTQTVSQSATTTTLTKNTTAPIRFGQSVTFTAAMTAVSPGAGTPTGTVTFMDGAAILGTAALSGGVATFTDSLLTPAVYFVTAVYSGDTNFTTSTSGAVRQTVNQSSTTTRLTKNTTAPIRFGQSVTFTATMTAVSPGAGTPTGTVTFMDGAAILGTATLSSGTATFIDSLLTPAVYLVTAVYSGDTNFATSTSGAVRQTVNQSSTTTRLTKNTTAPIASGQSVTFTATPTAVSPGSGTPTGTVTFMDNGSSIGTGTLSAAVATLATTALSIGSNSITAVYGGDADFTTSKSNALSQTVSA